MAEQKISNERKKELEQMDPFQVNLLKAMTYAKAHKNQLMAALGAVVAVIVIFSGIMASFKHSEDRASELTARAIAKYAKARDPQKGFEAVKDDFGAVFQDYSNTNAGKMARMKFAKICFDAGEYDMAFDMYSQAYEVFKKDPGLKNFLLAALGNVCQAKKDFDQARSYFSRIESSDSALSKDQALFALAGLHEAQNESDASRKLYEKLASDYKDSIYHDIAEAKSAN
ncbi:tetratricopeptide repeat protein [Desulfospira joergensenii]|uniref:tetratricopeptide repeat protein n=1 Tax=Desulfospira joergensenii TaxID=53329 RepID=UPI0003B576BB|nr:tetratricopeptide repeat protein [Desulfospira joergensenii]